MILECSFCTWSALPQGRQPQQGPCPHPQRLVETGMWFQPAGGAGEEVVLFLSMSDQPAAEGGSHDTGLPCGLSRAHGGLPQPCSRPKPRRLLSSLLSPSLCAQAAFSLLSSLGRAAFLQGPSKKFWDWKRCGLGPEETVHHVCVQPLFIFRWCPGKRTHSSSQLLVGQRAGHSWVPSSFRVGV